MQKHRPGRRGYSDFTAMAELGVTVAGEPLPHLRTGSGCRTRALSTLASCWEPRPLQAGAGRRPDAAGLAGVSSRSKRIAPSWPAWSFAATRAGARSGSRRKAGHCGRCHAGSHSDCRSTPRFRLGRNFPCAPPHRHGSRRGLGPGPGAQSVAILFLRFLGIMNFSLSRKTRCVHEADRFPISYCISYR